jgi:hypothetical protein
LYHLSNGEFSAQPEIIDKYPLYFQNEHSEGFMLGGLKSAFNTCNGEACVADRLTANLCENPQFCESRSRNFNYFFDYVDAIFFKYTGSKIGMITNSIGNLLILYLVFFSFQQYKPDVASWKLAILVLPFLFLPHVLSMDNFMYRSGKILTLIYFAFLFFLYTKFKNKKISLSNIKSKFFISLFWIIAAFLILSDEMAVFATGMLFCLFFVRTILLYFFSKQSLLESNINFFGLVFTSSLIIFYLSFRLFLEKWLALRLNNIQIISGGYADPTTFISFDFYALIESISIVILTPFYAMSIPTSISDNLWFYLALVAVIIFTLSKSYLKILSGSLRSFQSIILFLVFPSLLYLFLPSHFVLPSYSLLALIYLLVFYWAIYCIRIDKSFFYETLLLFILWVSCIYAMGLRHPYLITTPFNGTFYYFMPTAFLSLLFINIFILKANLLNGKKSFLILIAYLLITIGDITNINKVTKDKRWFFTKEDNALFLKAAKDPKNFYLNLSSLQKKTYISYYKFFQSLTHVESSCLFNECVAISEEFVGLPAILPGEKFKFKVAGPFKVGQIIHVSFLNNLDKKYKTHFEKDNGDLCCVKKPYLSSKRTFVDGEIILFDSNNLELELENISSKLTEETNVRILLKGIN